MRLASCSQVSGKLEPRTQSGVIMRRYQVRRKKVPKVERIFCGSGELVLERDLVSAITSGTFSASGFVGAVTTSEMSEESFGLSIWFISCFLSGAICCSIHGKVTPSSLQQMRILSPGGLSLPSSLRSVPGLSVWLMTGVLTPLLVSQWLEIQHSNPSPQLLPLLVLLSIDRQS